MQPDEFRKLLLAMRLERDTELKQRFDRSLPFGDAIFDRWERAKRLGFGDGASIYDSAQVYGDVKVGANTWIGPYTVLDGSGGGLVIGSTCSIATGVHIYTHDTVLWALSGGKLSAHKSPTSVGNCVYIGSQSVIAAGVKIGTRCVVGANSFVNCDVADGTIVGGSPARILGHVEGTGEDVHLVFDRENDASFHLVSG